VQKYSVFELKNRVKQGTKKQQYGLGNEGLCEEVFNHRKEPEALIPCQKWVFGPYSTQKLAQELRFTLNLINSPSP
jgi:hypothetical protein